MEKAAAIRNRVLTALLRRAHIRSHTIPRHRAAAAATLHHKVTAASAAVAQVVVGRRLATVPAVADPLTAAAVVALPTAVVTNLRQS